MAYYKKFYPSRNYVPTPKFVRPHHIDNFCTAEESDEIVKYLLQYTGTFQPIIDCRDKYTNQLGYQASGLSEKQWKMVKNSMERDKQTTQLSEPFKPRQVPHIPITVNKSVAIKHFKEKLKLNYAVFTLKVVGITNVVPSRRKDLLKLTLEVVPNTDGTVNVCRMCGKALTDHRSIVSGVGPYCAKRLGAGIYHTYKTDIKKFMNQFKKELSKVGTTTVEVWSSAITAGYDELALFVNKTKVDEPLKTKEYITITTKDLEWLPIDKSFVATLKKPTTALERLFNVVKSNKDCYINVMNPSTGNWVKFEYLDSQANAEYYKPCDDTMKKSIEHLIVKY